MARAVIELNEEVANGGGTFKPIPADWYTVEIEDVEVREVKAGKNAGKEMYNYKLKVVGGDYDGRKLFANACLWSEAIFTQRDIQAATGLYTRGETKFAIADEDELIGKELRVMVIQKDKHTKDGETPEKNEDGSLVQDNEVKKYKALNEPAGPAAAKKAGAKKAGGFAL